jgi:hypothetical protein
MVQIAFLTLFLGLTAGKQPVALTVRGPVAAVELVLDGQAVVRIGPPWRTRLDFGAALEPHELVARALDDKGQEVGRARQVLNLPRPPAEADILVENGAKGKPAAARVTWKSLTGEKPAVVSLLLDGQPVPLNGDARATLPDLDLDVSHILSAEVRFTGTVVARKDIGFGGRLGGEVSADLTAVPVRLRPGKTLPPPAGLQGWVLAGGKPAPVAAVEEGPVQLLIVRDGEARQPLEGYDRQKAGTSLVAGMNELRRFQMVLGKDDQMRFIWPSARSFSGPGVPAELFDASRDYTGKDGGILWLLGRALPETEKYDQRLADAVAVAGLQALAGNRPRAVLLVLGYEPHDFSRYDPATVRHYLGAVRVPLVVWSLGGKDSFGARPWGDAEDVSSAAKTQSAFERLTALLNTQRILWIEGSHLPGEITLSPAASEVVELVR